MRLAVIASLALVLASLGCSSSTPAVSGQLTEAEHEHTFPVATLAPGEEVSDVCTSWTLGNDEPLYVNAVELVAPLGGYHHSNWVFVPEAGFFDGDDGSWACSDRGFNEALASALGGVLFAQSTQSRHETQQFGEGVTIVIPPRSRVIGSLHLLNTGSEDMVAELTLGLHTIEEAAATTKLSGMSFTNEALALPANGRSSFQADCELATKHEEELGRELDFNLYYVLPHYHNLGTGMRIEAYGPEGSAVVFDGGNPVGDPLGKMIDPPFSMKGYSGLRFTCTYENNRPESVGYGIGDQEMCVLLAFTDSTFLWGGGVFGEPREPVMEDGMARFVEDGCGVLAHPASHAR